MTEIAAVFSNGPQAESRLQRMIAKMGGAPHDYADTWLDGSAGLSVCVQRTTAESFEASQPVLNDDAAIVLAFDGYLTNFDELRRDLEAHRARLRNRSDEELVLRAYEQWGEDCANRLEGEFALVIIDLRARRAFCARDHQGLRPLFYTEEDGVFLAASSFPILLAGLSREPEPNTDVLIETLAGEAYSVDQTVWRGVGRLRAAHWLSWSPDRTVQRRYYNLPDGVIRTYKSDADYIAEYRSVFEDAIRRTSRSHLPIAFDVSGGLDSSANFCLAHDLHRRGRLLAPAMNGFTLRGQPGDETDETGYARQAADFVGRDLTECELYRPNLQWFTDQAAAERDMPTLTNIAHSILMEQAMARSGARVNINGMGGDQWLDGTFAYYDQILRSRQLRRLVDVIRRDAAVFGTGKIVGFALRKAILNLLPDHVRSMARAMRDDYLRLMIDEVQYLDLEAANTVRTAKARYLSQLPGDAAQRINQLKLDQLGLQRAFDLAGRQRTQSGLEGRSPMFTRQFIEFSCGLPEDLKLRAGQSKWIHREAMRGLMPDSILRREDKAFFPERNHDAEIRALCSRNASGRLAPFVDHDRLLRFLERRHESDVDDLWGWPYWGVYMVAAFLDRQ